MEYAMDMFHSDYFPHTSARAGKWSFLNLRCENVVEFLEIKTHENVQFPGVSPFQVTPPLASSKLQKY